MNIVVCIKQIYDPEAPPASFKIDPAMNQMTAGPGVNLVISPFDEQAVEAALKIRDAKGAKVTVISLGKSFQRDVIKKPLSMGADELILLEDDAFDGGDSWATAFALSAAIKKLGAFDLIICGRQAADWDAGQVGSGLAEFLGIPSVTLAKKIEVQDHTARIEKVLPDGYEVIEASLPVLITVSNELGEPRYATLKGIMAAAKKQPIIWKPNDIGLTPAQVGRSARITKLEKLFQPEKAVKCEIIEGENPADAGTKLALKLREAKLI